MTPRPDVSKLTERIYELLMPLQADDEAHHGESTVEPAARVVGARFARGTHREEAGERHVCVPDVHSLAAAMKRVNANTRAASRSLDKWLK